LEELLAIPEQNLGKVDIARMNLLCATGLPNAENLDVEKCLATLDQWAEVVKTAETKYLPAYHRNPAKYENSLSKFKAIYLVLTIQEELRCWYNMELIRSGAMQDFRSLRFFNDSRDLFLHGFVERQKGTCASIPVLAVALGRRCGYPLHLVSTKGHLLFRWDDGKERFNVEASSDGTDIFPMSITTPGLSKRTRRSVKGKNSCKTTRLSRNWACSCKPARRVCMPIIGLLRRLRRMKRPCADFHSPCSFNNT
jgi:hypothetical protein